MPVHWTGFVWILLLLSYRVIKQYTSSSICAQYVATALIATKHWLNAHVCMLLPPQARWRH
jgi:hypothetical protein